MDFQYLGICLLFFHIRKREDLEFDLKEKILMIVFAPVMQMTFLASFIYCWSREDKGNKVEIIFMRSVLTNNFLEEVPFPVEAVEDAEWSCRE